MRRLYRRGLELNNCVLGGHDWAHGVVKSALRSSMASALKLWSYVPSLTQPAAAEGTAGRSPSPP